MNNNRTSEKHWLGVLQHLTVDVALFITAFLVGFSLRFAHKWTGALSLMYPGIILGAIAFGCAMYVLGHYTLHNAHHSAFKRAVLVALGLAVATAIMLGFFYLNFSTRIGRGALFISGILAYLAVLTHHLYLLHKLRSYRERVALIVSSAEDEAEAELLRESGGHYLNVIGVIAHQAYVPSRLFRQLGDVSELREIAEREDLKRILCTTHSINDPALVQQFCRLRYSGVTVMQLVSVFEEICHCVPVELISPEWLLSASGSPNMLYIKKLKRAFDIIASLTGLFAGWLFLLPAMLWVKLVSSGGPALYRQTRCGRFGKPFTLFKLRTMRVDAESADTAVWATAKDTRAIFGGNLLRRYRIDEIPQMWNVLRGEMSFVGPRPERPEFIADLARQIPYYMERQLIQPGITGWAQVNHPYGASVTDARHKLEYDLYYAKNMSLFLDVFILLDTVRIILRGGMKKPRRTELLRQRDAKTSAAATSQPAIASASD